MELFVSALFVLLPLVRGVAAPQGIDSCVQCYRLAHNASMKNVPAETKARHDTTWPTT
jgi:hypothetical protein